MFINIEYLLIFFVMVFGFMINMEIILMKIVDGWFCIFLLNKDQIKEEFEFFLIC